MVASLRTKTMYYIFFSAIASIDMTSLESPLVQLTGYNIKKLSLFFILSWWNFPPPQREFLKCQNVRKHIVMLSREFQKLKKKITTVFKVRQSIIVINWKKEAIKNFQKTLASTRPLPPKKITFCAHLDYKSLFSKRVFTYFIVVNFI